MPISPLIKYKKEQRQKSHFHFVYISTGMIRIHQHQKIIGTLQRIKNVIMFAKDNTLIQYISRVQKRRNISKALVGSKKSRENNLSPDCIRLSINIL